MKKKNSKKFAAGMLSLAVLCTSLPIGSSIASAASTSDDIIFSSGFEDGDGISEFTGRGGVEVIEAVSDTSYSGDYSMRISGREKSWNGPQLLLDNRCEAGVEYIVSAVVKAEWYNTINLSMEYTDSEGTRHYSNLKSVVSNGDWVEIEETKFSFSDDVTNVYVYIEGTDKATLYVDDFVLKKAPTLEIEEDIPSLKDVYSSYFKIGTAVTTSELASQTRKSLISKHFNSITLGNELKPDALLDQAASQEAGNDNPQISLASARTILNYCRDNNISVRGHVLVWHSQTPDWFFKENFSDDGDWVDQETMLKRMENYIKNVFTALEEEYPDVDFYAWDVVNEAWTDTGTPRNAGSQGANGSSNSAWVQIFGDNSFIEYAFRYAREYAPEGCKLYYNDYNEYVPAKTDAIVEMATELQKEGLIDGIGLQSHLDTSYPTASVYETALQKFAATGLDIQVTELDITDYTGSEETLAKQTQLYSDIMDLCVKYSDSISAVVFWGTTDDASWRSSGVPLLFDADYVAKSTFYSIVDGLDTPTTEPTTEPATEEPTTEPSTIGDVVYGDANDDGVVDIDDVVAVTCYVGDPVENSLSDTAMISADVYGNGDGVNAMDALTIQKYLVKVIDTLPETE